MYRSNFNLGLAESLVGVRGILGPGTAYPSAYSYPHYGYYGYPYGYYNNPYDIGYGYPYYCPSSTPWLY